MSFTVNHLDQDADSSRLLFIYGSLKRGQKSHGHLENQRFVSETKTQPFYQLFDCGDYPALVHSDVNGASISGELFEVSTGYLRTIDEFENVDGGLYAKERILLMEPFEKDLVLAYVYLHPTTGMRNCGDCWP